MSRQSPTGLVALAFDNENMRAGAQALGGVLDYRSAIIDATAGQPWIGTAVVLVEHMTAGVARFLTALRRLGLSVVTTHRERVCGRSKVCDDVVLAAEAATLALDPRVHELVLLSGDGDLAHVCEIARRGGKRVTVAAFRETVSHKLVRAADEVVFLTSRHVIPNGRAA